MTIYKCKECGSPVTVVASTIKRPCAHVSAGVTADISATATGECKVASK